MGRMLLVLGPSMLRPRVCVPAKRAVWGVSMERMPAERGAAAAYREESMLSVEEEAAVRESAAVAAVEGVVLALGTQCVVTPSTCPLRVYIGRGGPRAGFGAAGGWMCVEGGV